MQKNNCILLGAGAVASLSTGGDNEVVLGGAADTVFMGGASGVSFAANGITLGPTTELRLGSSAGTPWQVLRSGGPGAPPAWSPAAPVALAAAGSLLAIQPPLASQYTVAGTSPWRLALPSPSATPYEGVWINANTAGSIGWVVATVGAPSPSTRVNMAAGDSGYFMSDGASAWWAMYANRALSAENIIPVVTGVSLVGGGVAEGPAAGGFRILIAGQYFTGAVRVVVGGANAVAYTVESDSLITATAPVTPSPGPDQTAEPVQVHTVGGVSIAGPPYVYYDPVPVIDSVTPPAGTTGGGGARVTIAGTGLVAGSVVTFDGVSATGVTTSANGRSLTALPPARSRGRVVVDVITIGGTATGAYDYVDPPTIASFSPAAGPTAGGTQLTITGTNLLNTTAVQVRGVATAFTVDGDTQITATAPGAAAGLAAVAVTTLSGSASAPTQFHYQAPPAVSTVTPAVGPLAAGAEVSIVGSNFFAGAAVAFGGEPATITVISSTEIRAVAPAGGAGPAIVVVTTAGGTATSMYTYSPAPTISGISPAGGPPVAAGPLAAGAPVRITGAYFYSWASAPLTVTFGGAPATNIVVTSTSVEAAAPASALYGGGDVSVEVTTPSGTASTTYTYLAPPTLDRISPPYSALAGAVELSITGSNFFAGTTLSIGGVAATHVVVNSATSITAELPAGAADGPVNVTVTTVGGAATAVGAFTYKGVPSVTGISPAEGPLSGGTSVLITGTNFHADASVTIGGVLATQVSYEGPTVIRATTAQVLAAGAASVIVQTIGGESAENSLFTFMLGPTISSVSPTSGFSNGGNTITIRGANFYGQATSPAAVTVGGAPATAVIVANATTITAVTPAGAQGSAAVVVTTPSGATTAPGAFTYAAAARFAYKLANQVFVVPSGVLQLTAAVGGSAGGRAGGCTISGTIEVTPATQLTIVCGGQDGIYAGSSISALTNGVLINGGGYSAILRGAADAAGKPAALTDVLIMAGGAGGGHGTDYGAGGAGGFAAGGDGESFYFANYSGSFNYTGGGGANTTGGGSGGTTTASTRAGSSGTQFQGGAASPGYGAGGGGGLYGGGGSVWLAGGGGGSSYVATDNGAVRAVQSSDGSNMSLGYVELYWD